jgi:hypothetical protein
MYGLFERGNFIGHAYKPAFLIPGRMKQGKRPHVRTYQGIFFVRDIEIFPGVFRSLDRMGEPVRQSPFVVPVIEKEIMQKRRPHKAPPVFHFPKTAQLGACFRDFEAMLIHRYFSVLDIIFCL